MGKSGKKGDQSTDTKQSKLGVKPPVSRSNTGLFSGKRKAKKLQEAFLENITIHASDPAVSVMIET